MTAPWVSILAALAVAFILGAQFAVWLVLRAIAKKEIPVCDACAQRIRRHLKPGSAS